jgi:hypothetical protein
MNDVVVVAVVPVVGFAHRRHVVLFLVVVVWYVPPISIQPVDMPLVWNT